MYCSFLVGAMINDLSKSVAGLQVFITCSVLHPHQRRSGSAFSPKSTQEGDTESRVHETCVSRLTAGWYHTAGGWHHSMMDGTELLMDSSMSLC